MKKWFFFVSLFFIYFLTWSQINKQVKGKINLLGADNLITVEAQAENLEPVFKENLFYTLLALKLNSSGNYSSNRQSGNFALDPEEQKKLSSIKLNLETNELLKVYLFIKQGNLLVAKDSIFMNASKINKYEESAEDKNKFGLKGIVIESVITKIGKDFYDYFYQAYLVSGNQQPFIIYIKEKPYFGYSSIITIEVDDKKIFEFFSKPEEEYLKSAVYQGLQKVNKYAKQRKILFKNGRI